MISVDNITGTQSAMTFSFSLMTIYPHMYSTSAHAPFLRSLETIAISVISFHYTFFGAECCHIWRLKLQRQVSCVVSNFVNWVRFNLVFWLLWYFIPFSYYAYFEVFKLYSFHKCIFIKVPENWKIKSLVIVFTRECNRLMLNVPPAPLVATLAQLTRKDKRIFKRSW